MFWFISGKKEVERLRKEVSDSFGNVRKDFNKVGQWIKHIDDKEDKFNKEIESLKIQIFQLQEQIDSVQENLSFFKRPSSKQPSTGVQNIFPVQTVHKVVQTDVQTSFLDNLTTMERAILWTLINSEMHLSYEDIATLLGKDRSTVRGQINTLKQKNPGLIGENRELGGKKRVFIEDSIKQNLLKTVKVRVKNEKKYKKLPQFEHFDGEK